MAKLILFDIDGTLIQSGGAGVKAFARAFETEFGIADGTEKLKFAGRTDVSLVREFFGHNGIEASPENFKRYFKSYLFWLEKMIVDCSGRICPGALDFLAELKALPNPPAIGLLTGNIRRGAEIKLSRYQLWEYFSFGGFADDHEERDCIAAIARQRGIEFSGNEIFDHEVIVIGDTPLDVRCARAINARVIAVATGGHSREELETHKPDWLLNDLTELSASKLREL